MVSTSSASDTTAPIPTFKTTKSPESDVIPESPVDNIPDFRPPPEPEPSTALSILNQKEPNLKFHMENSRNGNPNDSNTQASPLIKTCLSFRKLPDPYSVKEEVQDQKEGNISLELKEVKQENLTSMFLSFRKAPDPAGKQQKKNNGKQRLQKEYDKPWLQNKIGSIMLAHNQPALGRMISLVL